MAEIVHHTPQQRSERAIQ